MSKYNTISNFLFNNTTPVLLPVIDSQTVIQYHGILHFSGEVVALLVLFLSLFIYLAFKHCSLIKSFNSLISSHDTES